MPTVLIVEDERKLRDLLRGYLERDGITVLSAGTGAEGLGLASNRIHGLEFPEAAAKIA